MKRLSDIEKKHKDTIDDIDIDVVERTQLKEKFHALKIVWEETTDFEHVETSWQVCCNERKTLSNDFSIVCHWKATYKNPELHLNEPTSKSNIVLSNSASTSSKPLSEEGKQGTSSENGHESVSSENSDESDVILNLKIEMMKHSANSLSDDCYN